MILKSGVLFDMYTVRFYAGVFCSDAVFMAVSLSSDAMTFSPEGWRTPPFKA